MTKHLDRRFMIAGAAALTGAAATHALAQPAPAAAAAAAPPATPVFGTPPSVVTNPPRTGMAAPAVDALRNSGARCIAYVSCDPATLARDVALLVPAYRLAALTVFDQFPQTAHMECLAVLERR